MKNVKVFGIRHHGPGSAARLQRALTAWAPDCLLVECPDDAEDALRWVSHQEMDPPVALLVYNPKDLRQASFLPFARFSPEWQALLYAQSQQIPVKAMDLPLGIHYALREQDLSNLTLNLDLPTEDPETEGLRRDPLRFMAQLAGFSDSERWWERTFEEIPEDDAVFEAILEMITALREPNSNESPASKKIFQPRPESKETLLREAYMRKTLRQAQKEGFQRIAVVCGAWHAPVLEELERFSPKNDNALLKGLKKTKTLATWIPWSYQRLAYQSGYAAGILSPAWYELLFDNPHERGVRWLARVAELFRKKDLDASAAHVMEASRLADTLATLRGLDAPGIADLEEAVLAIFCQGDEAPLQLIRQELIVGEKRGRVPTGIAAIPLQKDFESAVQSAGLKKDYQSGVKEVRKEFDLRKPGNALASHLLHRLNILDIRWGDLIPVEKKAQGSFHEWWLLHPWDPEYIIQLIEMGMWGNTLREAVLHYALHLTENTQQLPELLERFGQMLKADIPEAIGPMVKKLQDLSAQTKDIFLLLAALPPLVQIVRYGNVRQTDGGVVEHLLRELLPRIVAGYPQAISQIDEDPARELFRLTFEANQAIALLYDPEQSRLWESALMEALNLEHGHPLLQGFCTRMLFDKSKLEEEETATYLFAAISKGAEISAAANWLEGFLYGNGQLLIQTPSLWLLLNDWVSGLEFERFREALPIMRRTFSQFTASERAQLMRLAKGERAAPTLWETPFDPERAALVTPVLKSLLGI